MADQTQHKYLLKEVIKYIQSTARCFLYYARDLDLTMPTALNDIGIIKVKLTQYISQEYQCLIDYIATYPNVIIRYYTSNIKLYVDSNAAYLVLPNAKS